MPMSLRDSAIELMDKQLFREALLLFQKMIEAQHSDWNIFYMAGQCCRFIDDLGGAISYLKQADKLNPDEPSVLLSLGIALQLKELFNEASHKFRRAIEIDPDFVAAYNSLAVTQRKMGELKKALQNYDLGAKVLAKQIIKAMRNEPGNKIFKHKDIKHNLWIKYAIDSALYLCCLDKNIQGIAWPTGEMAMREEYTEHHKGLYWLDQLNDDGERSRLFLPNYFNTFRETLRQDSIYSNLIGNRGTVLELLGQNEEAQKHFDEASYFLPELSKPA